MKASVAGKIVGQGGEGGTKHVLIITRLLYSGLLDLSPGSKTSCTVFPTVKIFQSKRLSLSRLSLISK